MGRGPSLLPAEEERRAHQRDAAGAVAAPRRVAALAAAGRGRLAPARAGPAPPLSPGMGCEKGLDGFIVALRFRNIVVSMIRELNKLALRRSRRHTLEKVHHLRRRTK